MAWGCARAVCVVMGLLAATSARSQTQHAGAPDADTAMQWARGEILAGRQADFNDRCPSVDKIVAPDPCRTVTASFVQDMALAPDAGAALRRLDIAHAIVDGDIDLRDAVVAREVSITHSLLIGGVDLSRARFASRLSFDGSTIKKTVDGSGLHVAGDLHLEGAGLQLLKLNEAEIGGPVSLATATVAQGVDLPNARIGADLNLFDATISALDGNGARIDGRIFATNLHAAGDVSFGDATTRGDVWFEHSDIGGDVLLDSAHIGSTLHMIGGAVFRGAFTLDGANIDHYIEVAGARFDAGLSAQAINVGQETNISAMSVSGPFKLNNARLDGDLTIRTSTFRELFDGRGLTVRGLVKLTGSRFEDVFDLESARIAGTVVADAAIWGKPAHMPRVHVGQDLDLGGATLPGLDLSGAMVDGMLIFSRAAQPGRQDRTCWAAVAASRPAASIAAKRPDCGDPHASLSLLNTHAGAVQGVFDAWPSNLKLSGFSYGRIDVQPDAGAAGAGTDIDGWDHWLQRDKQYSAQHYLQVATAMSADGDRQSSADIQFRAREQERALALKDGQFLTWGFLTLLCWIAGYGIGDYTWRAVYWVVGLTLLGAVCVWLVRRTESRNVFWPVGASLERLLPYVRLDKAFTEFFDQQKGFLLWHKLVFGFLALMGSVLGLFLAAAASGLTQKG